MKGRKFPPLDTGSCDGCRFFLPVWDFFSKMVDFLIQTLMCQLIVTPLLKQIFQHRKQIFATAVAVVS